LLGCMVAEPNRLNQTVDMSHIEYPLDDLIRSMSEELNELARTVNLEFVLEFKERNTVDGEPTYVESSEVPDCRISKLGKERTMRTTR
jgi:hypothetical protein